MNLNRPITAQDSKKGRGLGTPLDQSQSSLQTALGKNAGKRHADKHQRNLTPLQRNIKEVRIGGTITTKARAKVNQVKILEQKIMVLDKEIETSRDNSLLQEREVLKNEIGILYHEEAMGAYVRSRCKWIE